MFSKTKIKKRGQAVGARGTGMPYNQKAIPTPKT